MDTKYFNKLNYSLGDEDSSLEYHSLSDNCPHVMAIAGSGGRVLPLLAKNPRKVSCVDFSEMQLHMTELRLTAVRQLEYDEFLGFFGYPPFFYSENQREKIFESLKISNKARSALLHYFSKNNWKPVIYTGRFEKMLISFSKVIKFLTRNKIKNIFQFDSLQDQKNYVESSCFPSKGWEISIKILGNANLLNYWLYKGEFPKKNIPGSYSDVYKNIFNNLFMNIEAKKSLFLQLLLLGSIQYPEGNPIEADKNIYQGIKDNIENIEIDYLNNEIINAIQSFDDKSIGYLSLSDIPSFLNPEQESRFLQNIKYKIQEESKVIFRGHLRVIKPVLDGYTDITSRYSEHIANESTQLWTSTILERDKY